MANKWTEFADLINQEATSFTQMVVNEALDKNAFYQSGVMGKVDNVTIPDEGRFTNIRHIDDLNGDAETWTEKKDITVDGVTSGQDTAAILMRVKAFGQTDLASDLMNKDFIGVIASRFGFYWARQDQKTLFNVVKGALGSFADNTLDISSLTDGADVVDGESIIDAESLLGDRGSALAMMAMHSRTYYHLKKRDLIEVIKDSQGQDISIYQGKQVIVDDGMPFDVATGAYTTYLFGSASVAYAEDSVENSAEVARDPFGQGGKSALINRRKFIMHPSGIEWKNPTNLAYETPTNAELADSANWGLVYDPKKIRIVSLKHKIA